MQQKSSIHCILPLWVVRTGITVILVSLVLHAFQLFVIFRTRAVVQQQVATLVNEIEEAQQETISFNLQLDQPVPIRAAVPIQQNLTIPISTTVQVDEKIDIPLSTPFGLYRIPVPIQTDVPVQATVPITVDETFNISTTVELDMNIPIDFAIDSTLLADYLDRLHQHLTELQETF
ncbi:MAG: hypothetical protein GFH27_549303n221 [Chloroflexi bacterium AL-W]|nr:hypothetical protein [Chloroflexi bacterium AL-N1]NOK68106.1 hypothetical protein [Chloroflexi bacterium AL-N10]NOK73446.1 hypothetical protein [Chloroflexi bacterium AL-N5]NOK83360.1 hypothetical protein [Chloroflexi bacterium AL-W]NOK87777.1 hypothetical protein [Chloroflexi bacterium AL-N15]